MCYASRNDYNVRIAFIRVGQNEAIISVNVYLNHGIIAYTLLTGETVGVKHAVTLSLGLQAVSLFASAVSGNVVMVS